MRVRRRLVTAPRHPTRRGLRRHHWSRRAVALGREPPRVASPLLGVEHLRLSATRAEPTFGAAADERRIPLDRTSVPISVTAALGDTTRVVQELDTDQVNDVVQAFGDIATETQDVAGDLFTHLDAVASAIAERDADVSRLVDSSRTVTATLAERDQQLVALVDAAGVLLDQIASRRDELAAVLGEGSAAVRRSPASSPTNGRRSSRARHLHLAIEAAGRTSSGRLTIRCVDGPDVQRHLPGRRPRPWIDVVFGASARRHRHRAGDGRGRRRRPGGPDESRSATRPGRSEFTSVVPPPSTAGGSSPTWPPTGPSPILGAADVSGAHNCPRFAGAVAPDHGRREFGLVRPALLTHARTQTATSSRTRCARRALSLVHQRAAASPSAARSPRGAG